MSPPAQVWCASDISIYALLLVCIAEWFVLETRFEVDFEGSLELYQSTKHIFWGDWHIKGLGHRVFFEVLS